MTELHNDSNETTTPMIGDVIRAARTSRNVSLKIIAQHTKISYTNLEALEANNFASLPNKAYVKGYVKSCAKLLGLDEEECLNILQANYDILEKPQRLHEQKQQTKVKEAKENNELVFKMAGVVIVILILVTFISNQDGKDPSDESAQNAANVESEVTQDDVDLHVTPVVLSDSTPLRPEKTPQVVATPVATATPEVVQAQEVVEEKEEVETKEEIKLRPITGTLYNINTNMSEDDLEKWLPANFRAAAVEGKQNVFINAIDGDTWLTYQTDNGDIKKFILKKDQKLFITGDEILLFLGNYKVTRIFLNNQPLDIQSRSGVKSLVFPQSNAKDHFYPLFIYKDDGTVVNSKTYNASL